MCKRKNILLITLLIGSFILLLLSPVTVSAYGWGYKKNDQHQLPDIGKYGDILHKYGAVDVDRDRKSTRLNSSHVSISYAVFCLKKKTLEILLNNHYFIF